MDINELIRHIHAGEGTTVEFKVEFPKNATAMAKEMAAFANTDGGIILVGISDEGQLIGVSNPDQVMQRLAGVAQTCNLTSEGIEIGRLRFEPDKYVVWAEVSAQETPRIVEGRFYKRIGSAVQPVENGEAWQRIVGTRISQPTIVTEPPRVKGFKGRKDELQQLIDYLLDDSVTLILIEGISGVGKTALAAQLASQLEVFDYQCLWVDCRTDTTLDAILWSLVALAQAQNDQVLANALADVDRPLEERILNTAVALSKARYALFLDDYQFIVDPSVNRFIQKLEQRSGLTKVVLTSRVRPKVLLFVNPMATKEVPLQSGLDLEACTQVLAGCGLHVDTSTAKQIWELTGKGHPKALLIFAARARSLSVAQLLQSLPVFQDRLKQEWLSPLMEELPTDLRDLVIDLSILDRPFPFQATQKLYPEHDIDQLVLSLIDRFILDRVDDDRFSMHALIREHCYALIDGVARKHTWAAHYYLGEIGSTIDPEVMTEEQMENCLAAWSHFIRAGEHKSAVEVVSRLRKTLINQGQYEQLMFLIEETVPPTEEDRLWFTINEARIFSLWGDKDYALQLLRPLIDHKDSRFAREATLVQASVYCEHEEPQKAIELLETSSELFRGRVSQLLQRRFLMRMVWAYRLIGDLDKAFQWAARIAKSAEESNDMIGGAVALRNMAAVFQAQGLLQPALGLCEQSYELFTVSHRLRDAAVTQVMLGELQEESGNHLAAITSYEEAFQTLKLYDRKNSNLAWQKLVTLGDAIAQSSVERAAKRGHPTQ